MWRDSLRRWSLTLGGCSGGGLCKKKAKTTVGALWPGSGLALGSLWGANIFSFGTVELETIAGK